MTQPSVEVVTTPTSRWLSERAAECRKRFLVASPFVNDGLVAIAHTVPASARRVLVTRTVLHDFAAGASSLTALCSLAESGTRIERLNALHAKVYVFDDTAALVTSANATRAGLNLNRECGLAVYDVATVRHIAEELRFGFGAAEPPEHVSVGQLRELREPVDALRRALPPELHQRGLPGQETPPEVPLPLASANDLLEGFSGWTRLTLEVVLGLPADDFTAEQAYAAMELLAARRYPRNRHVNDKVRQQLQRLRDMGLVAFMGGGTYRRTVSGFRSAN